MALINCTECGAQISSTAIRCPKCGAPNVIEKLITPPIVPHAEPVKKKSRNKLVYILAGSALFIVILVVIIIYALNNQSEKNNTVQEKTNQNSEINDANSNNESAVSNTASTLTKDKSDPTETNKKNVRNNWYSYITVEHSDYTYREAGGIYDLYIKVTNNTDYTLNTVETSISYIKAKGDIYKTETVYFTNIAAHTMVKKKAPDSNRGTSVDYLSITSIKSDDLNFYYVPGNWAANSVDPYKYK